jgi:hypothetical protein
MASPKILQIILRANAQLAAAKQAIEQVGGQLPAALRKSVSAANAATAGLRRMGDELLRTRKNQAAAAAELSANNGYLAAVSRFGAAVFGTQQLRRYVNESEEAVRVQAQLAFALKQTGQFSADYIAELEASAKALQRYTGVADETISSIQRFLIQAGVGREQITPMTEAVLDLAAAMETDASSAARLVANVLSGTQESFGRYSINLDGAITRTQRAQRILETLTARGVTGQARAGFASQTPGLAQFTIQIGEAGKALGTLIAQVSGPFLGGLSAGLAKLNGQIQFLRELLPGTYTALGSFSRNAGEVIGTLAIPLGALAVFRALGPYLTKLGVSASTAAGFLALLNVVILALAAAIAGFSLGRVIGEFEVLGFKVKEIVEILLYDVMKFWEILKLRVKERTADVVAAVKLGFGNAKLLVLEFVQTAANALNRLPGVQIDTTGLAGSVRETQRQLLIAKRDYAQALADANLQYAKALDQNQSLVDQVVGDVAGRSVVKAQNPAAKPTTPRPVAPQLDPTLAKKQLDAVLAVEEFDLKQSYERRLISLNEYLRRRGDLLERSLQPEEQQAVQEQARIRVELQDPALGDDDRQRLLDREAQLSAQLVEIWGKRQLGYRQIEADGAQERERIAADADAVLLAVINAGADDRKKAEAALQRELADLQKKGADASQLAAYEAARRLQIEADAAKRAAEQMKEAIASIETGLQNRLAAIDVQVNVGSLSKRDGLVATLQARSAAANELQAALDAIQPSALQGPITADQAALADELRAKIAALQPTIEDLAATSDSFATGFQLGWKRIADATLSWSQVAGQALSDFANGIANGAANAFTAFIEGTENAGEVFRKFVADALRGIAQMIIQTLVLRAIQSTLGFGLATGGPVPQRRASGGPIHGPGGPTDDQVPIWASAGEWVIRAASVRKYGDRFLSALNAGLVDVSAFTFSPHVFAPRPQFAFASGGPVGGAGNYSADRSGSGAGNSGGAIVVALGDDEIRRLGSKSEFRDAVRRVMRESPDTIEASTSRRKGYRD